MLKFNISFCVSLSLSKVLSPHTLSVGLASDPQHGVLHLGLIMETMQIPELGCS